MLFQEALEQLKAGQHMCREKWSLEDGYLSFLPGMSYVWKIVLKPNPNAGNFIFSVEDFEANDWKKFEVDQAALEEPKETEEPEVQLDAA